MVTLQLSLRNPFRLWALQSKQAFAAFMWSLCLEALTEFSRLRDHQLDTFLLVLEVGNKGVDYVGMTYRDYTRILFRSS